MDITIDLLSQKISAHLGPLQADLIIAQAQLDTAYAEIERLNQRIAELEAQLGQQNQPEENTEIIEGE